MRPWVPDKFWEGVVKFMLKFVAVIVGLGVLALCVAGYSMSHESATESLHSYTADKIIEDYDFLVRNNGKWMDRCIRAGAVVQAYISAHEDDNFQKWTAIKKHDCAKAGL